MRPGEAPPPGKRDSDAPSAENEGPAACGIGEGDAQKPGGRCVTVLRDPGVERIHCSKALKLRDASSPPPPPLPAPPAQMLALALVRERSLARCLATLALMPGPTSDKPRGGVMLPDKGLALTSGGLGEGGCAAANCISRFASVSISRMVCLSSARANEILPCSTASSPARRAAWSSARSLRSRSSAAATAAAAAAAATFEASQVACNLATSLSKWATRRCACVALSSTACLVARSSAMSRNSRRSRSSAAAAPAAAA